MFVRDHLQDLGDILVPAVGYRLMGALLLAISLTTVRVDVAKNLVRAKGLPRYSAACMFAGLSAVA